VWGFSGARSPRARDTRRRPSDRASSVRRWPATPWASAAVGARMPGGSPRARRSRPRARRGPPEGEDQEHLHRPPPDPVDSRQLLDDRLIVETRRHPARRHRAPERVPCDVLDCPHLAAREAGPAQPCDASRRDVRGRRKASVLEQGHEACEDRFRSAAVELLVGDGARERLVRRPPAGGEGAGTVMADQPAHHRVAREVTVRVGHGGVAGHRDRIQRR